MSTTPEGQGHRDDGGVGVKTVTTTCFLCAKNICDLNGKISTQAAAHGESFMFLCHILDLDLAHLKPQFANLELSKIKSVCYCAPCLAAIENLLVVLQKLEKLEKDVLRRKDEIETKLRESCQEFRKNFARQTDRIGDETEDGDDENPQQQPLIVQLRNKIVDELKSRTILSMLEKVRKQEVGKKVSPSWSSSAKFAAVNPNSGRPILTSTESSEFRPTPDPDPELEQEFAQCYDSLNGLLAYYGDDQEETKTIDEIERSSSPSPSSPNRIVILEEKIFGSGSEEQNFRRNFAESCDFPIVAAAAATATEPNPTFTSENWPQQSQPYLPVPVRVPPVVSPQKKTFICGLCSADFADYQQLKDHDELHTKSDDFFSGSSMGKRKRSRTTRESSNISPIPGSNIPPIPEKSSNSKRPKRPSIPCNSTETVCEWCYRPFSSAGSVRRHQITCSKKTPELRGTGSNNLAAKIGEEISKNSEKIREKASISFAQVAASVLSSAGPPAIPTKPQHQPLEHQNLTSSPSPSSLKKNDSRSPQVSGVIRQSEKKSPAKAPYSRMHVTTFTPSIKFSTSRPPDGRRKVIVTDAARASPWELLGRRGITPKIPKLNNPNPGDNPHPKNPNPQPTPTTTTTAAEKTGNGVKRETDT